MTYPELLPHHQPDVRFGGDALKRRMHEHQGRVSCWTREVRLAITKLRQGVERDLWRDYLRQAWAARRYWQEQVAAHRALIAGRDHARRVLG